MVSIDRWSLYRSVVVSLRWPMEDLYSGLYRQVVLIQKCSSITEVAHGSAYTVVIRRFCCEDNLPGQSHYTYSLSLCVCVCVALCV